MKMTPEDPRLSAYLLGELSADDAAEVDRAAASDPVVRVSLDELQKTMDFLSGSLGGLAEPKLRPAQRQSVLRAGRDADQAGTVVELVSAKRNMRPWITGLAAAAAVTFAALLLNQVGGGSGGPTSEWADEIALLPMPGPDAGEGLTSPAKGSPAEVEMARQMNQRGSAFLGEVARKLEEVRLPEVDRLPAPTGLCNFSISTSLRLPIVVGKSSPVWVNRWMQENQELPPKRLVRVEEFVNAVSLRTTQVIGGIKVGYEAMDCPWNPESKLVAVQMETFEKKDVRDLEVRTLCELPRRVLGSFVRRSDQTLPAVLPAGATTLVMMEVKAEQGPYGELSFRQGELESSWTLVESGVEPSAEMARAVTMAAYALWLRGEIDLKDLDASVRAADEVDPGAVHRELRRNIEQAKSFAAAAQ